ncbi:MAG: DUF5667 domain-containing protein [Patescibacteria group bacterium]|jgi:hypothetical protein
MKDSIIQEIKGLKKEIQPRSEWLTLSRDILLQQINSKNQYQSVGVGLKGYFTVLAQTLSQRLVFEPAFIMLLVLGVFLGSSLTINAAFYSLPGETLYPLKLTLEKTHMALVTGDENKVELKIEFAQKRVAELDKIIAQVNVDPQQKKKNIEAVVKEFKNNVVAVNDHLNKIKEADQNIATTEDKETTLRMALTVSSKTEEMAKSVDKTVEGLSDAEKLGVEQMVAEAVQSAQETSLSAQQLVAEANQATEEQEPNQDNGVIDGAETPVEPDQTKTDSTEEGDALEASIIQILTPEEQDAAEIEPSTNSSVK